MKIVLVTQRVGEERSYKERRDSLDQRWSEFFNDADIIPIFMPNNVEATKNILSTFKIDGLLLTGGNSLFKYGGDAPERDEAELFALTYAIEKSLPVLGVCRGMQLIQDFFGVPLVPVEGHVATRIHLDVFNGRFENNYQSFESVNAYHNLGTKETSQNLKITASSAEGVVMAIEHVEKNIYGCMWHPERENPFNQVDLNILKEVFGGKK